jgi:hypothetical protein
MGREPFGFGPGPELNSFTNVQSPTNNNNLHKDASCAFNTPHVQTNYLETAKRRRSNGPSDISERAAKKVTSDDLFRHFFRKAVAHLKGKGKKRSASPTFNSEVN